MMELRIIEKLNQILSLLQGKAVEDKYMDITQVSDYSALSKTKIRSACADGTLKHSSQHGKHLFKKSNVERWLEGEK